jgi:hypothetical protein
MVKNDWSSSSIPPVCLHGMERGNFTFYSCTGNDHNHVSFKTLPEQSAVIKICNIALNCSNFSTVVFELLPLSWQMTYIQSCTVNVIMLQFFIYVRINYSHLP